MPFSTPAFSCTERDLVFADGTRLSLHVIHDLARLDRLDQDSFEDMLEDARLVLYAITTDCQA